MVRFKTKAQQQAILNTTHLLFDNKSVIIKERSPDVALIKHDVQKVPIWTKLYGLEVKFWGKDSLRKLSGEVGSFIKCDDSTANRSFFWYARVLIEVQIGQSYPKEIVFKHELGETQRVKVEYDWLPLSCTKCKGMGHLQENCRKGETIVTKKVWRPKPRPAVQHNQPGPKQHTPIAKPVLHSSPIQNVPNSTPVCTPTQPVPAREESPVEEVQKVGAGQIFPRRILSRMRRQEFSDSRQYTPRGITFMDALNLSISKSVSAGKRGVMKLQLENGGTTFWFTLVYSFNKEQERVSLWSKLNQLSVGINTAWIVCCDFNNLLNLNEIIGGAPVSWNNVIPMRHMVGTCNLAEVKSIGAYFTWNRKHESGSKIYSKLDRVFVNGEWLTSYPECFAIFLPEGLVEDKVSQNWVQNVKGTPMYRVVTKLKSLKKGLRDLNNKKFSDIENITRVTEISLKEFQVMLIKVPLNKKWCEAEAACAKELILLKKARDQYLLQKSKEKWMEDGDDSTGYYHASIKHRRLRNKVYQVKDKNGGGNCITEAHRILLAAPVNDEEVRLAMFSIPGTKAPGPDGYSSQFFKDGWAIVRKDVIAAVKHAYQCRKLLKKCNTTILTLISKTDAPDSVLQFRPIACCNTIYKCVAKHSQSAFVKGKDIVGNILLTEDLIKMYKRKACLPRILMKVDLQKAYDSVEWSFLCEMLDALGFPTHMVELLMILDWFQIKPEFRFHPFYKRVKLSHLCFADDLIMFCRGDKQSLMLLLRAFQTFSQAYGLNMHHSKSNIYSNGVEERTMIMLERISGMRRGRMISFKYLGVNITPKRLGVEDCHYLIERISARIQGLGARKLSYAGRVILIKSVLSTLHNYWARIFILPKTIINRIEAMCRKFLWHGNDSKGSPALVAWDQVCQSEKKGGLGLKHLYWWNVAAVAKYVWWLAIKTDHLWVRWIHVIHIKNQEWFDYKPGVGASWAWKKICWVKHIIKPLLLNQGTDTYAIKQGYQWLVEEGTDKEWHPWISNSLIIPRHKCTIWLTAHKRLLTMDRLMRMGIVQANDWLMIQLPKHGFIEWWVKYRTQALVMKQVVAVALANMGGKRKINDGKTSNEEDSATNNGHVDTQNGGNGG
ncbi:uncharacterized protein LOC141629268 [Silene latifolia]|uniref:uncharacterized protein LOC141629268 n=1 Tax=Silene latifolia TaxID=37657 RepID=UPI003D76EEFE